MTHEQHAKKFIEKIILGISGFVGEKERKQVDVFFHHLKEAIKKEVRND